MLSLRDLGVMESEAELDAYALHYQNRQHILMPFVYHYEAGVRLDYQRDQSFVGGMWKFFNRATRDLVE
jgi:hypothetical protein